MCPIERRGFLHANLTGAHLKGAQLNRAYLERACLNGFDSGGTAMADAVLLGSQLRDANLQAANLSCANLRRADLSCADLRDAILCGSDLGCAHLMGARGPKAPLWIRIRIWKELILTMRHTRHSISELTNRIEGDMST